MSTEPTKAGGHALPPMEPSDESTRDQLKIARAQGDAYGRALEAMNQESGAQMQRVNDYEIAVVAENAEGMYQPSDGRLRWENPTTENVHIEVAVRDASDGRFIPGLPVHVTVYAPNGEKIGTHQHEFLWHPWLYHYGRNWSVPAEGDYRIHVRIEPPLFMRHDRKNGDRYTQPAELDFSVHIKPGQKLS